jgi:Tol biopolymer transport system component
VSGSPSDGAIWRVERDTGALTPLGLTMRRLRNIDVSDDGRYVTFTSGSPMSEVWMLANFLPAPGTAKR